MNNNFVESGFPQAQMENALMSLRDKQKSLSEKQGIVDDLFSEQRRESLVQNASLDSKGRHDRYYRWMAVQELDILLEKGSLTLTDFRVKAAIKKLCR